MANLCIDCKKPTKIETHARCDACVMRRYRKRKKEYLNPVHCIHCKTLIGYGEDVNARKRFCSDRCKQADYREREKKKTVERVIKQNQEKHWQMHDALRFQRNEIELEKNEAAQLQAKINALEMTTQYLNEELQQKIIIILGLIGVIILIIIMSFIVMNSDRIIEITSWLVHGATF